MKMKWNLAITLLLLTTSCAKQSINDSFFPISMGLSYEKGEYQVTYQVIDPSVITTPLLESNRFTIPVRLLHGTGYSIVEAMNQVEFYGSHTISLRHIQSILLHRSFLDALETSFDQFLLNYIGDPTFAKLAYLYVSDTPLDDLYLSTMDNNVTYYASLYNTPNQANPSWVLKPTTLLEVGKSYFDQEKTTYLPRMNHQLEVTEPRLQEDGACFLKKQEIRSIVCFNQEDLVGMKWLQGKMDFAITAPYEEILVKANVQKNMTYLSNSNGIRLVANIELSILYDYSNIPMEQLTSLLKDTIMQEIQSTYQKGKAQNIDVYNVLAFAKKNGVTIHQLPNELPVDVLLQLNAKVEAY